MQLIRRVLRYPNAPAVISLHYFSYWHAKPSLGSSEPALFYNTKEDDMAVVAQFYDVPVLSLRCAGLAQVVRLKCMLPLRSHGCAS